MKKYLLLAVFGMLFLGFGSADCLNMDAGNLCLRVKNQWEWTYVIEKTFQPKVTKSIYMLNCQVLKPDNKLKDIGACASSFTYTGSWLKPLRVYVYIEWQKNVLNMNRNFTMITKKQANSISNLYAGWNWVVQKIVSRFPVLNNNAKWKEVSNDFYKQLWNFLYGESVWLKSYAELKNALVLYVRYTINQTK